MPILDLQRSFRELGRIRLGQQVEGPRGMRPEKLETFRLTSDSEELLQHAAVAYGGIVAPWGGEKGDDYELVTETAALDIIIPPGEALTQWNEMWGSGGCIRRCDGKREMLSMQPCLCPADPGDRNELASKSEACKPTSRLSVILPKLPDLGVWLLVSHGYYAAVELAGSVALLQAAREAGRLTPALLVISKRSIKRQGEARKDIVVPAISIPDTMDALMAGGPSAPMISAGQLVLPDPPPLPADPSFARGFAIPVDRPLPLTYSDLKRLIHDAQVSVEHAGETFRRLYPNAPTAEGLTDAERGLLWQAIAEPASSVEAPSTPASDDDLSDLPADWVGAPV